MQKRCCKSTGINIETQGQQHIPSHSTCIITKGLHSSLSLSEATKSAAANNGTHCLLDVMQLYKQEQIPVVLDVCLVIL